jgi:hypothetical protein
MSEHLSRRRLLGAIASAPALAVPALVIAKEMPSEPITDELISNYSSWLFMERRLLHFHRFGDRPNWHTQMKFVETNNAFYHHFPWDGSAQDFSRSERRAAAVLQFVGCDWRERPPEADEPDCFDSEST